VSSVWTIQHVGCETLGTIADVLRAEDISFEIIRTYAGQPLPKNMDGALGLIIMGGPMGVYEQDRYPFLRAEIRLIESALKEEKPVLGVCLGSQLLAAVLGAEVKKGKRKEIGWHPVTLTESVAADPLWTGVETWFTAYHWHGDVFDLPPGAVHLASSDLTACQAFRYGQNAYGLLFHIEVTEKIIEEMVSTFADELQQEQIDGREILEKAGAYLPELRKIGDTVFQRWASLAEERSKKHG
jgi:GMP synthase (glutamine-hydrolysing)